MDKEKGCPYCGSKMTCIYTSGRDKGTEFECGTQVNPDGEQPKHEGYDCDLFHGRDVDCYERELALIKKKQEERDKLVDTFIKAWDAFYENADYKWSFGCEKLSHGLHESIYDARSNLREDDEK